MIKNISIHGLRGFGEERTISFAIPQEGVKGSGLTILVGSNNAGKTTILEAIRSFNCSQNEPPSFAERKRNIKCENGTIHLKLQTEESTYMIDTVESGGSATVIKKANEIDGAWWETPRTFILQSRRFVEYEFHRSYMERQDYIQNQQMQIANRTAYIYEFNARLFKMQKNKEKFNILLKRVLGYDLEWTIEQNDNGTFYLKFMINGCVHSSEGLGDGIWSIFTICDALYDSEKGSTIAIDEPELSLHPAYQKKIMELFNEFSQNRQIIISTHSPYFVDAVAITNGAYLYRTVKNSDGNIDVFKLSDESKRELKGFLNNINQPHTLGTEAKEIFFLEDRIIITEGQEDVIMYKRAADNVGTYIYGTFFGWGAGGASNIQKIAMILNDLGYKKVSAIFDGDKPEEKNLFQEKFPEYQCLIISAPDIRDKKSVNKPAKEGVLTEGGKLKEQYREEIRNLFMEINSFFQEN